MAVKKVAPLNDKSSALHRVLDIMPDLAMVTRAGRITYLNPAARRFFRTATNDDLRGRSFVEACLCDPKQDVFQIWRAAPAKCSGLPVKLVNADGEAFGFLLKALTLDEDGEETILICGKQLSVVGAEVASENLLASHILDGASLSFLCICDKSGIRYMNPGGLKLLGYDDSAQVVGTSFWSMVDAQYRELFDCDLSILAMENTPFSMKIHCADERELFVDIQVSDFSHSGEDCFLVEARDVTSYRAQQRELLKQQGALQKTVEERTEALSIEVEGRKRAQETVKHLTHHDTLTGLLNRKGIVEQLKQSIHPPKKLPHLAVLVLDLDNFKTTNDNFGHVAGDVLLRRVADRLQRELGDAAQLARLGGDEFALMVANGRREEATAVAEQVLELMKQPFSIQGHEIYSGCSIGIALYPEHTKEPVELVRCADMALYHAKNRGRGISALYHEGLKEHAAQESWLENRLRGALRHNEFELYYQPQIDLQSGRMIGAEALIRWNCPGEGMIRPDQFIPVAEKCGLIDAITDWVMTTACTEVKSWQDAMPGVRVAVNLSPVSFRQADFVDKVREVLEFTGVTPDCLELEITETAIMMDSDAAGDILGRLADLGVHLAIDDFGTGYSSLAYLKRFPVDKLKIDKSFVFDMESDADDAAIISAIISMAHAMGLKVVAEGVEKQVHLDALAGMDCEEAQGYFFARPMPAEEFMRWCASTQRGMVWQTSQALAEGG